MADNIEEYEGEYVTRNDLPDNTSHSSKAEYYPGVDVKIRLWVEEHTSHRVIDPVKIKVIRGKVLEGGWKGAKGFEAARFYFQEGILVSDPIKVNLETNAGDKLTFSESVILLDDGAMLHRLSWSDGDFGFWGCR